MATCELFLNEEIDFDEDIAVEEDESYSVDESFDWDNSEFNDFDEDEPDCIPLIVFIDDEGVSKITPAMVSSSSNTSTTTPVQKNKKNVKQKEKEKGKFEKFCFFINLCIKLPSSTLNLTNVF